MSIANFCCALDETMVTYLMSRGLDARGATGSILQMAHKMLALSTEYKSLDISRNIAPQEESQMPAARIDSGQPEHASARSSAGRMPPTSHLGNDILDMDSEEHGHDDASSNGSTPLAAKPALKRPATTLKPTAKQKPAKRSRR